MERIRRGSETRLRDIVGALCALGWILSFAAMVPCEAAAQALSVAETESLVRASHYEGLPEEEARRIGAEGAARLVEMLEDEGESRAHANILLALGLCGDPAAFDAIRAWARTPRDGEVDRNVFRAWQALPYALGHLARQDRRAVAELETLADEPAPTWRFRHHRGARLGKMKQQGVATSLAITGLPEAALALDRMDRRASDPELSDHLREVRALHRARAAGETGRR